MANFIAENDDPAEGNVPQPDPKPPVNPPAEPSNPPVEPEPEVAEPGTEPQPESTPAPEPTIEIDGQQIPLSQAKEALEVAKNQKEWKQKNTQRAMELAERERQLQEASLIAERAKANPQLLQQLFAPQQERDFNAELQALWAKRPQDIYSQEYANWEFEKDRLNSERLRYDLSKQNQQEFNQVAAVQHNNSVEAQAHAKYDEKVSPQEFLQMGQWIIQHIQRDQSGKFPKDCFDTAYRNVFFEKAVADAKLDGSKKAAASILNAKPASGAPGATKRTETKTPEELDDADFVGSIKKVIKEPPVI